MRVTFGIATWNRASTLRRTLLQLRQMAVPANVTWELIVVNNNSTDNTQDVLSEFSSTLPLTTLFEPRQGRSWALNRVVHAAGGDYIVWIDDDILVEHNFLTEYASAFAQYPDAGIFGGAIVPRFECAEPPWLSDALDVMGGVFGLCEPPSGPIDLAGPFLPFGGNMATRTQLQRECLYDVRLGRQGRKLLAGEESKAVRQMIERGAQGRWVPTAIGHHLVPPHYVTVRHIRDYFFGRGASMVRDESMARSRRLLGRPRWAWRQAIQCELQYRFWRICARSPRLWLTNLRNASTAWGVLLG